MANSNLSAVTQTSGSIKAKPRTANTINAVVAKTVATPADIASKAFSKIAKKTANTVAAAQLTGVATLLSQGTAAQAQNAAFDVDSAVKAIESLRTQASTNHETYDVAGRKAMLNLMAQVYRVWHDAQVQGEFEVLMNNVGRLLKDLGVEVRKNSPASSQLIRYVFSGIKAFSAKQVHVYGRSLNVAFAATPRVKPDEFYEFVEKTPDGFNGLREIGSTAGNSNASSRSPVVALSIVQNAKTCETIEIDWPVEDKFRVYIAVRNADGATADLKEAQLSNESKEALLLKVYDDLDKPARTAKKAVDTAEQVALAQLQCAVSNQRVTYLDFKRELEGVKASGTAEQQSKTQADVKSAKVILDSMIAAVKEFREQIKAN